MPTQQYIKLGRQTALISFLLGTLIFGLYFLTSSSDFLLVGYGFIILAGLVNTGILIAVLSRASKDKKNRKGLLITSALMLVNIPIMLVYCWIVMILLGTMRITFTNDTETKLTDIKIVGCGGGHIDKLEIGESKTVWITITGDCSIYIDYLSNGQRKKETVAGYVTSSMGQKAIHKIDGKDKDIFNCKVCPEQGGNSKYYTQQDTILITTEIGDTLKYAKIDFNNIVDNHKEFFEEYPDNPDLTYFNNNYYQEFGSEAGQDYYYILYAYFLKQKNGVEEFAQQRQKLIDIYSNINSLFAHFEYGGTYFGHQSRRILAYAEYSIYLLPKTTDEVSKTYDITKQKNLYIKSLRQLIEDESEIDFNTFGQEKIERTKKLHTIVDDLDKLITDNVYLRRAQEFHYGHYEYY